MHDLAEHIRGGGEGEGGDRKPTSSRHDGRPFQSALLSPRNTCSDEENSFLPKLLRPSLRVRIMRIPAIDDDVSLLQERQETLDVPIHDRPCLHHQHHLPRKKKPKGKKGGMMRQTQMSRLHSTSIWRRRSQPWDRADLSRLCETLHEAFQVFEAMNLLPSGSTLHEVHDFVRRAVVDTDAKA